MQNTKIKNMVLTGLCVGIGLLLPQLLHSVPYAGQIFLPMHIPVLLCGLLCGATWGLAAGLLTPLLSSLLFSMPPMAYLPGMLLELAVYGLIAGLLYRKIRLNLFLALLLSMLAGRIAYGLLNTALFLGGSIGDYSFTIFFSAMFVTALPGIVIQIVLLPALVFGLEKTGVVPKAKKIENKTK